MMALTAEEEKELEYLESLEDEQDIITGIAIPVKEREKEVKETVKDVPISALQSLALEFGDEAYGAVAAAAKDMTGDPRPYEDIYTEMRDIARGKVDKARERSPVMTFLTDIFIPNPMKVLRYGGKILSKIPTGPVSTGAVIGSGAAEETEDIPMSAGIGAGAGLAAKGIQKVAELPFTEPRGMEARFLGMEKAPSQLKKSPGLKFIEDTKGSLDRLRKSGMFSKNKKNFSTKRARWVGDGRLGVKATSIEDVAKKMDDALSKSSEEIENILSKQSPPSEGVSAASKRESLWSWDELRDFDEGRLQKIEDDIANRFGPAEQENISKAMNELRFDILPRENAGDEVFSLLEMQNSKRRIYRQINRKFGTEELTDSGVEVKKRVANLFKDFINEKSGSDKVKNLNQTMEDVFAFQDAVNKKVQEGFLTPAEKQARGTLSFGVGYRVERLLESLVDPSRLYRAKATRLYEDLPDATKQLIEGVGSAAPGRTLERMDALSGPSRRPQSIPQQLVRTRFPRTTQELLENRDVVLAKIAQQAPELFDTVQDVYDYSPEDIGEVIPGLITAMPELFANDPYNRFDGVILDPESKEKARVDTMKRDDLSNTEKIEIINRLNKTGEFE